jgi:hypothetical protein
MSNAKVIKAMMTKYYRRGVNAPAQISYNLIKAINYFIVLTGCKWVVFKRRNTAYRSTKTTSVTCKSPPVNGPSASTYTKFVFATRNHIPFAIR